MEKEKKKESKTNHQENIFILQELQKLQESTGITVRITDAL